MREESEGGEGRRRGMEGRRKKGWGEERGKEDERKQHERWGVRGEGEIGEGRECLHTRGRDTEEKDVGAFEVKKIYKCTTEAIQGLFVYSSNWLPQQMEWWLA